MLLILKEHHMGFLSLKHCEKTRELWKHTGKQTPQYSLLWLLWTGPKALRQGQLGFHRAQIMERYATPLFYSSSYFLRIKCRSAAHASEPKPQEYYTCLSLKNLLGWAVFEEPENLILFIPHPHFQTKVSTSWEPPHRSLITWLGVYIWRIHSWTFPSVNI
jgi:hypothetical protein